MRRIHPAAAPAFHNHSLHSLMRHLSLSAPKMPCYRHQINLHIAERSRTIPTVCSRESRRLWQAPSKAAQKVQSRVAGPLDSSPAQGVQLEAGPSRQVQGERSQPCLRLEPGPVQGLQRIAVRQLRCLGAQDAHIQQGLLNTPALQA
jgi:hypothetical protein